jgi:pyruvate dehydrogenase E1 component beta subunit
VGVSTKITYREAVAEALRMEMGRDPSVVYLRGESADSPIAEELERLYGAERVLRLAAGERTVIGAAVGMAFEGFRPVCEIRPEELPSRGLDQLVEAMLAQRRDDRPVPLVVRVPCGADAATLERWLVPVPGLKVVAPTTAADAKGLLSSAIRDPAAVCFLELIELYGEVATVPEGGHLVSIGEARVAHPGDRLTVVAHGDTVGAAVKLAQELDAGIEVIDLRTLAPLDRDRVLASVRRTGKVAIIEAQPGSSQVAADVIEAICTDAFEYLDAPLRRVVSADGDLRRAIDELLAY